MEVMTALAALFALATTALANQAGGGADDCATADGISGQGTFAFDLTGATTGGVGQDNCCSFGTCSTEHDVWFEWTADASGTARLQTCTGTGIDTKVAVYSGVGCPLDGTALACNDDDCHLQSRVEWSATSGATYTIQLGTFTGGLPGAGSFELAVETGTPLCFGDGSGAACPCGNHGASGEGCDNSTSAGGRLFAAGAAEVANEGLVLTATNALSGQMGVFFQGEVLLGGGMGLVFGDGLRCCGGAVVRLALGVPDLTGCVATDASCGVLPNGPVGIAASGGVAPGDTRCYQFWYRDPLGPCDSGFNLSQAIVVAWQ